MAGSVGLLIKSLAPNSKAFVCTSGVSVVVRTTTGICLNSGISWRCFKTSKPSIPCMTRSKRTRSIIFFLSLIICRHSSPEDTSRILKAGENISFKTARCKRESSTISKVSFDCSILKNPSYQL